jgi:GntR family transcriptional regulator / MocR family aminotransferase
MHTGTRRFQDNGRSPVVKNLKIRKTNPAVVWKQLLAKPKRLRGGLSMQLVTSFIDAIDGNAIPDGTRIPSSRSIAESLNVGRNTVISAISVLIEQGYLVSKDRSGVFVATKGHFRPTIKHNSPVSMPFNWNERLRTLSNERTKPDAIYFGAKITHNFKYGQFDLSTFPTSNWRQCERSALGLAEIAEWGQDMFDRDDVGLVESLRRHVLPNHGIWAEPDEVLVTLGGQEGRYLVAQLLCKAGVTVGLENPGLPDMNEIVAATPARRVFLPVDEGGACLSPELKQCDVAFVMPGHHCPTTVVMPYERRLALLELARRRDMVLVEDTYETEILSHGKLVPSVKSLDSDGRVIHIASLSKCVAPGLRIGFVVASPQVIDELRAIRRLIHRHPPGNIQRALAMFIDRGYYHSYLRRISTTLASRTKALQNSLNYWLPDERVNHCEGAASFWIELSQKVDARALCVELSARGVLIEAGDRFFIEGSKKNCLRIAVSQIPVDKIDSGVEMLSSAMA